MIYLKQLTNNPAITHYIKNYCQALKYVITQAKHVYFGELTSSPTNKTKSTWDIVNHFTEINLKNNTIIHISIVKDESLITDPVEISNDFKIFFEQTTKSTISDVTSKGTSHNYLQNINYNDPQSLFFQAITEIDIVKSTSAQKSKKFTGNDNIPITLIKRNIDILSIFYFFFFLCPSFICH